MYTKEDERLKVLAIVRMMGQEEIKFNKQQNFERAIELSLDEVAELEALFQKFMQDASHLEVFRHSVHGVLSQEMDKISKQLRYLITKNYTQAEKNNMPVEVIESVKQTQERRFELLRNVAKRYLLKPKTD